MRKSKSINVKMLDAHRDFAYNVVPTSMTV